MKIDNMKLLLRGLIPSIVIKRIGDLKRSVERNRNHERSAEEVFTRIYQKNLWGGRTGEFCLGAGTSNNKIVSDYVSTISLQASLLDFEGKTFVDLGYGDFRVGKQLLSLCSMYIGIYVVKPLILFNKKKFGDNHTKFMNLDIVEDDFPEGDVCFIRQVFQHLSNKQITQVLGKLNNFKYVLITEHYPTDNNSIKTNIDKIHGGDIRVYQNSGVYLS
jgi:hypothetical protein